MGITTPFSKKAASEIRTLAAVIFDGGDVSNDEELKEMWGRWKWWFDLFFMCIDREHASFLHFPNGCTITEQGYKTMQILTYIQNLYIKKINDMIRKI